MARYHAVALSALAGMGLIGVIGTRADRPSAPSAFARFVDEYLDEFARRHPSIAAGNGIHVHDDRLEDFSPTAIAAEIATLKRQRAFLSTKIDSTGLTPDERVDRRI